VAALFGIGYIALWFNA